MARYIDADEAIRTAVNSAACLTDMDKFLANFFVDAIKTMPTADVKPAKYPYLFPMGAETFAIACGCCKNLHSDKCMKCKCEIESGWELDTERFKPVVHAHWETSDIPCEEYVCSNCGGACWYYDCKGTVAKSGFCPHCGAKMDEEENNI